MTFHGDKFPMRIAAIEMVTLTIFGLMLCLGPASAQTKDDPAQAKQASSKPEDLKPEQQASKGSVTISGTTTPYDAFAGTIVVHPKGWDDVPQNADKDDKNLEPEASMFYVAYFKSGEPSGQRPITFFYNGGPGSSTVCPTRPTLCLWTRQGPVSAASLERIGKRCFMASMRMPGRLPISFRNFWRNMDAGIRRSIFSVRATGPRVQRH